MTDEPQVRDPGEPPVLDWIDKALIDVDPTYQRELDEARVQRILDWFDWSSFGALVVAPKDGGRFNCTDGQHRLEAAKRHPLVWNVPGVIIAKTGTASEAENFVSINANRRNVTPLQIYWAELAAGDPEAQTVDQVCARAGVSIIRSAGGAYKLKAGDTTAIGAVRTLVGRNGALRGRQMLEVLAKAELTPITALQVKAVELLLTDAEFKDEIDPEALTGGNRRTRHCAGGRGPRLRHHAPYAGNAGNGLGVVQADAETEEGGMTSPTPDQQQRTIVDLRRQVSDLTRKNKAQRVELARMKRAAAGKPAGAQ